MDGVGGSGEGEGEEGRKPRPRPQPKGEGGALCFSCEGESEGERGPTGLTDRKGPRRMEAAYGVVAKRVKRMRP